MSQSTLLRRIFFINHDDDEGDFSVFKRALEYLDPSMELYYLPGCNYSHFGAGNFVPDIIFLDLKFSNKEGFLCLKDIRNSGYAGVPVVMYASSGNEAYVDKAYQCGANLFMIKPANFERLLTCLEKVLKKTDWQDPAKVTHSYFINGKHHAFEGD